MRFMEWLQLIGWVHGNIHRWSSLNKSSVSRTRRLAHFQILWFALERWIRTQHQILFRKNFELVQEFVTIQAVLPECRAAEKCRQAFGTNMAYRISGNVFANPHDGIRVENFPGFTTLQLINRVYEFMTKVGDPSQFVFFLKCLHVDVQWHLMASQDNEQES